MTPDRLFGGALNIPVTFPCASASAKVTMDVLMHPSIRQPERQV